MANVVYLHGRPTPISEFLRIGASGHRQLEVLLAAGQLPAHRLVVEAGSFAKQTDLITALKQNGRELVLDTNVAELSSVGRFQGVAQGAPWANPDGVLTPGHFKTGANEFDVVGRIARFAVANNIQRVQSPTHVLSGVKDGWFAIDRASCELLRRFLNIEGGKDISIDYPLMIPNGVLNDAAERKAFVAALASLPIDSLWLRISGFGADATAQGLRKYITAAQDFHQLGKPIISDGIGGMTALAIVSFGAACGLSHGVAEKERFDTSKWNNPPRKGGGGGGYNVLLSGIDRLLKKEDAEILTATPGGRRLFSCHDRSCCPLGFEDTIKDPKGHYLRQRASQYRTLSAVPEQLRAKHFLDNDLTTADRTARQASRLKVSSPKLGELLIKNSARLDRMRAVLEDLYKTGRVAINLPSLPAPFNNQEQPKHDRH